VRDECVMIFIPDFTYSSIMVDASIGKCLRIVSLRINRVTSYPSV
jgi:hypothetical protein